MTSVAGEGANNHAYYFHMNADFFENVLFDQN